MKLQAVDVGPRQTNPRHLLKKDSFFDYVEPLRIRNYPWFILRDYSNIAGGTIREDGRPKPKPN